VRHRAGRPDLTFHELRHWCGHHFYVTLGFSADEAGAQLGHKDGSQILQTYGHGAHGALEWLQRGTAAKSATRLPLRSAQTAR
jgi:integrase